LLLDLSCSYQEDKYWFSLKSSFMAIMKVSSSLLPQNWRVLSEVTVPVYCNLIMCWKGCKTWCWF